MKENNFVNAMREVTKKHLDKMYDCSPEIESLLKWQREEIDKQFIEIEKSKEVIDKQYKLLLESRAYIAQYKKLIDGKTVYRGVTSEKLSEWDKQYQELNND
jgi:hypothetical protein